jgi:hypothetical protein
MLRRRFATPFGIACTLAIALGCIVRARPVLLADFPLNDGGLFYVMTEELQRAHFRLPEFTGYNAARIPFAYPPFGLYIAGMLAEVPSWTLMRVVQLLPLATTCATLVAFLLLARQMLTERVAVVAALIAFALVPRSFIWLVMGGGLTRAFGFLFTILALHQAYLLFTRKEMRFAIGAGVFAGLTPMSHLGTAPFLAASLVIFFIAYGRHRRGLIGMAIVGAIAIVVSAPWWVAVVRVHGVAPFLAAGGTGGSILTPGNVGRAAVGRLARLGALATGEPLFPVIGVLAVLGGLASLRQRAFALPVWWVVTLALDSRAGETYATLPVSLLAGIGVAEVMRPLLFVRAASWRGNALAVIVGGFFVAYGTLAAMTRDEEMGAEAAVLASLSRDERDAMRWIASNTPPASRFFVVPEVGWPYDKVSEWFPVLAARPSVATVQGREWLPNGEFARSVALYRTAQSCGGQSADCLDRWAAESGAAFSHVFIARPPGSGCCRQLHESLRSDPRYALVFDGPGGEIFERRDRTAALDVSRQ